MLYYCVWEGWVGTGYIMRKGVGVIAEPPLFRKGFLGKVGTEVPSRSSLGSILTHY